MSVSSLDTELIGHLAPRERDSFDQQFRSLRRLPSSDRNLPQFLDDYLAGIVGLFAATAGAIWFRGSSTAQDTGIYSPKAQLGMERLALSGEAEAAHLRLIEDAARRGGVALVKPFSAPRARSTVSNPTDSFVLLGPVRHRDQTIGVVELLLGPTPPRGTTAMERKRYVAWLAHCLPILCDGIERRFLATSAPLNVALDDLARADQGVELHREVIRRTLEQSLHAFVGWNFGTIPDNQAFAGKVHELLERHGFRVLCPECGAPAILRCQAAGNARSGVFLFDHYLDAGRTFHGGPTTFPRVTLVAKPPRRRPG